MGMSNGHRRLEKREKRRKKGKGIKPTNLYKSPLCRRSKVFKTRREKKRKNQGQDTATPALRTWSSQNFPRVLISYWTDPFVFEV
jgi:hypothetical protein